MPFVTLGDGVRLFYESCGDGSRIVLVPNGLHLVDDFERLAPGRALVFYDLRNRGRSDATTERSVLTRGVEQDVDDLDVVRRHFDAETVDLIGHSYAGVTVVLAALKNPAHVGRIVQIGASPPQYGKQYPPHLSWVDETSRSVFSRLAELQKERPAHDPEEFCRKVWSILRLLYVTNPDDAPRTDWGRCDLPNERGALKYFIEFIVPSLQRLELTAERLSEVRVPVLTIHGLRDRSAPYGGGREWAMWLPNGRLVTVAGAGHAPWIESRDLVFRSIDQFLGGGWPDDAQRVTALDPADEPC